MFASLATLARSQIYIYIHISREISIEHPSVGLASLAQLCLLIVAMSDYLPKVGLT